MSQEALVKRNILACYISDAVLGTYFQLAIWVAYQSLFLNLEQMAFYAGLALVVEVLMQMPTGAFADIFGRRVSLALGNLFMALPMFLIAFQPKPEIMWLYSVMWGLGTAFCMGTNKPILYETLENAGQVQRFAKIQSNSIIIFQISAALSITIGGYLYQVSPQLPYFVSGIASLFGVFTSFLFLEPTIIKEKRYLRHFIAKNWQGIQEIFKNRYMVKLTIFYGLLAGIAAASQRFFAQPFMLELGLGDIQRSWVAMLSKLGIAFLGAWLVARKRIASKKAFILIIPVVMVIVLIPANIITLPLAFLTIIGVAFTSGNTTMFLSPEINRNIRSSVRSTATSAQKMLASLLGAIIQWIGGPIILATSVGNFYHYLGIFALILLVPLALNIMRDGNHQAISSN